MIAQQLSIKIKIVFNRYSCSLAKHCDMLEQKKASVNKRPGLRGMPEPIVFAAIVCCTA
jgi:hypothetical protein